MPGFRSIGSLERQVLEFLWKNGPSTSDEVRAEITSPRPLADSTIRTVLRRLEAKEYVKHERKGRQFLYSSVPERRRVAAEAVRGIVKNFCRGSVRELLIGLVDHKVVDGAELRRLAEIIERREREADERQQRRKL